MYREGSQSPLRSDLKIAFAFHPVFRGKVDILEYARIAGSAGLRIVQHIEFEPVRRYPLVVLRHLETNTLSGPTQPSEDRAYSPLTFRISLMQIVNIEYVTKERSHCRAFEWRKVIL